MQKINILILPRIPPLHTARNTPPATLANKRRGYRLTQRHPYRPRPRSIELRLGVPPVEWGVKRMKTKWGTCNIEARRVWLNLELVKKPPQCLEYVIVHELTHLLERHHNERFTAHLDKFLPQWRTLRAELNESPLREETWE
ncbi:MAG: M48 family metallopeptidase [Fibrella sp.]|nr:M48 family metallopeptidase [Armatimonadota bacterium]